MPLVVANPPRAGLGRAAHLLASLDIEQMLLVSCNPTTLCRDLVILRAAGFAVRALDLFDMFPWTRHVETLVWLSRGSVVPPQY